MKYNKIAVVIEDPATDEWSVSFTSHNPQNDECVRCKNEDEAWKMKKIWDSHNA